MPNRIVTEIQSIETYPAPECNLLDKDVERFVEELENYARLFEHAFRCVFR